MLERVLRTAVSNLVRLTIAVAATAALGSATGARSAHAQASGTLQATVTVLAAAEPLHLQLAASESRAAEPRLTIKARPELADVRIDTSAVPLKEAGHPQVRVTVAYLR